MNRPPTAAPAQGLSPETQAARRRYDAQRPYKHLYASPAWKGPSGLRLVILRRDPVCTACGTAPSTVADHIKDHRGDLKLFYSPENVRGVCKPCHDKKTGSMYGGGDRAVPVPPAIVDGKVANQGPVPPAPRFDAAVDYSALLQRHKEIVP